MVWLVNASRDGKDEITLVLFKTLYPDLPGQYEVIVDQGSQDLLCLGLTLVAAKRIDFYEHPDLAKELYKTLIKEGKTYFRNPIRTLFLSPPLMVTVWSGPNAVARVREWQGPTKLERVLEADCFRGKILREFGVSQVPGPEAAFLPSHSSDSPEAADREIRLFFPELEDLLSQYAG